MRSRRRLIAALVVAALCAPGIFLRTEVTGERPRSIALEQIAGAGETGVPGWNVAGVWHYSTEPTRKFGGFSALLPLGDGRLRAFSDRGFLFTFVEPDREGETAENRLMSGLPYADEALYPLLWDIESATRDPAEAGDYWLGYENTHAIHRFSYRTEPEKVRMLNDEVDWYDNGGLEAMVRLSDGRFFAIPEGQPYALLYPSDPVEGGEPTRVPFTNPAEGFAATDMTQLPDGRILVLMRDTAWGVPPFTGLLALAEPPAVRGGSSWSPTILFRFDGVLPPENYEGIALRPMEDGRIAVWIMSDDNLAALQRTLLVKLIYNPAEGGS